MFAICYTGLMWQKYNHTSPIPGDLYQRVYQLLCNSIPPEERREESVQHALLKHSAYTVYTYAPEGRLLAMLAAWEFPGIRYIDHFAVDEAARGLGLGGKLLESYLSLSPLPVVLEVEVASASDFAARRIAFYQRHGVHLNEMKYEQPPLRKGFPWIPMRLMTWPDALDRPRFDEIRLLIYREVYGLSSRSLNEAIQRSS